MVWHSIVQFPSFDPKNEELRKSIVLFVIGFWEKGYHIIEFTLDDYKITCSRFHFDNPELELQGRNRSHQIFRTKKLVAQPSYCSLPFQNTKKDLSHKTKMMLWIM